MIGNLSNRQSLKQYHRFAGVVSTYIVTIRHTALAIGYGWTFGESI